MKNITLSADETLIEAARRRAARENTTLNAQFRQWLAEYTTSYRRAEKAMAVIRDLQKTFEIGGSLPNRDELNRR